MFDWDKQEKLGFFMGEDTLTPVKFIHKGVGTGNIEWKYHGFGGLFSRGREMSGISKAVLGNKFYLYTGDKKFNKECWIFNMDIQGRPIIPNIPPNILRVNEILSIENRALKAELEGLKKLLFDSSHQDRLSKEAIVRFGFRKEALDASMSSAEQYGGFGGYSRFGGIGIPPRVL